MCIIAYAPRGQQIKEEVIRRMFQGNPDGAGIMWKPSDSSQVEILKGFMKIDDLLNAYSKIPVECEKAIHCRIATAGKVSVGCCHPFPVRAKTNAMKQAQDSAYMALMHNGIIDYCNPVQGMQADYSDSMVFAAQVLYPLQKQLDTAAIQLLIENSTTSRLLIFRKDAETLMFGNWKYEDGIYYSNDNYKMKTYGFGYGYGGYKSSYWNDYEWDKTRCSYVKKPQKATPAPKTETKKPFPPAKKKEEPKQLKLGSSTYFEDEFIYEDATAKEIDDELKCYGSMIIEIPEVALDLTKKEVCDDLKEILAENGHIVTFTTSEFSEVEGEDEVYMFLDYEGYIPPDVKIIGDYSVIDNSNNYM